MLTHPRLKFPVFFDPAERYPIGSPEWAGRISSRAWAEYNRAETVGFKPLLRVLDTAVPGRPWLAWPPDNPWGSIDVWSMELFGQGWAKLLAIIRPIDPELADRLAVLASPEMPAWGEVGNGRSRDDQIKSTQGGTSSSYLAARLKRDRPDLATEVEAGRMSLRAAARKAEFIKDPDRLRDLRRAWKHASPEQRRAFLSEVAGGEEAAA